MLNLLGLKASDKNLPVKKVSAPVLQLVDVKSPFESGIHMHRREKSAVSNLQYKLAARGSSKVLLGLDTVGPAHKQANYMDDDFDPDKTQPDTLNSLTTVHSHENNNRPKPRTFEDDFDETEAPTSPRYGAGAGAGAGARGGGRG